MADENDNTFELSHRLSQQQVEDAVRFSSQRSGGHGTVDAERIDVLRADNPFFRRILDRYTVSIQSKGHRVLVPTVEAAVALKFAAAISPNRGADSTPQDRADLLAIIRKNPKLDSAVLGELGDLVYPGGGKELQQVAAAVGAGRSVPL